MHTRGISDLRLNNFVVRLFVYRREIHLKATSLRVHVRSQRSFLPWISELSTAVQRFQYDVQQNISCSDGGRRFFDTHAVVRLFEENGPGFIPLRSFTILPLRFIYLFIFLKSCWLLFFPREIFPPRFHHSAGRGAGQDPGADDQLQHGSHLQRHGDQGAAGETLCVSLERKTASRRRSSVFVKVDRHGSVSFCSAQEVQHRRCCLLTVNALTW